MNKRKTTKQTDPLSGPCPYCADPDFFDKVLTPTTADKIGNPQPGIARFGSHWPKVRKTRQYKQRKLPGVKLIAFGVTIDLRKAVLLKTPVIIRGKYHVKTVTDKDMIARYAGFTARIIGVETEQEPPVPSGPFMSRSRGGLAAAYVLFDAVRITHADSPITIDIHWRPEHGRIVTVRGFSGAQTKIAELAIINRAFEFYKQETRGGPKIEQEELVRAVRGQGRKATQKSVAATLGVSDRALREQLRRRAMTWDELKSEALTAAE